MITRTAIFEGQIKPGLEEAFFTAVKEQLFPLWCRFPGAHNVRYQKVVNRDDEAPAIVMIQQIDYENTAAIEAALRSPARTEARAATLQVLEMFEGRFYHVLSEAGDTAG